jgi:hypothetical protein
LKEEKRSHLGLALFCGGWYSPAIGLRFCGGHAVGSIPFIAGHDPASCSPSISKASALAMVTRVVCQFADWQRGVALLRACGWCQLSSPGRFRSIED